MAIYMAWFDLRARYSRSIFGPLWLTLQAAIFITIVGTTLTKVFQQDSSFYLSSFAISYVMWMFLSGTIMESTGSFMAGAAYLKDRGIDPMIFLLQPFLRQSIFLLHTLLIPAVIITWLGTSTFLNLVLSLPGFFLFILTAFLFTAPVSVFCVRFRDARPIIESLMTLLFLISPILWPAAMVRERAPLTFDLNPISHLMSIWRDPLFHGSIPYNSYLVVIALDVALALLFVLALRKSKRAVLWL